LSDADIRVRDVAYADSQREAVRRYVQTGQFQPSQAIPWWGCLLMRAVPSAGLAWLLL
jgi:hypothetical protein